MAKAKKQFSLEYFCEPLMENPSYFSKRMFGGLAIYCNDLMIFTLVESPGDRSWRGQSFDFDLWNGVLVCTSREHHQSLQKEFPDLISHPILGKWLYCPMSEATFESTFSTMVELVQRRDARFGIVPSQKKRKTKAKKKTAKTAVKISKASSAKKKTKKKLAKKAAKKKVAKKKR